MKRFFSLFLVGAALLPAVLSADTFEGKVTMTLTAPGAGAGPHAITYSTKNNVVRIDTDAGPRGSASIILDTAKQQMTLLMPQQSMYLVRPMPTAAATNGPENTGPEAGAQGQAGGYQFTKTAETAKILGYDCVKYTVTSAGSTTELWVTDQLGTFAGFGAGMGGRRGAKSASWEDAIKGKNFFPLKVIVNSTSGEMRMEATAVQKESLPDSDFVPPAGWKDMSAMMQGMQGMMPGGRPSGN